MNTYKTYWQQVKISFIILLITACVAFFVILIVDISRHPFSSANINRFFADATINRDSDNRALLFTFESEEGYHTVYILARSFFFNRYRLFVEPIDIPPSYQRDWFIVPEREAERAHTRTVIFHYTRGRISTVTPINFTLHINHILLFGLAVIFASNIVSFCYRKKTEAVKIHRLRNR